MSRASDDFNYKVALASGLKSLRAGRLRQAEEQFRYLATHFPAADGGYRGLAKVLIEQEDRAGALRILLDGGAAMAKGEARAGAIALYREAVALDPTDLAAHRRLAAALTLAGETDEAAREYARFIDAATTAGDAGRAELEHAYASARAGEGAAAPAEADAEPAEDTAAEAAEPVSAWMPAPAPAPLVPPPAPSPAAELVPVEIAADADAQSVEATAATYLAQGDPRAASATLEAARRYIADGRMDAASDLLLQLIGAGIAEHEAQRLLVDVTTFIGKRDVARTKVELLVRALRLVGRNELAAEVEQLAQAS